MPLNNKIVCLELLHIFPLGDFEVFREILENVLKIYTGTRGVKGTLGFLGYGFDHGST
jgi:hypothetical protein